MRALFVAFVLARATSCHPHSSDVGSCGQCKGVAELWRAKYVNYERRSGFMSTGLANMSAYVNAAILFLAVALRDKSYIRPATGMYTKKGVFTNSRNNARTNAVHVRSHILCGNL